MKWKQCCIWSCFVALVGAQNVQAQEKSNFKISVFNESTSIPFTKLWNEPFHPGIQLGTDLPWKAGRHYQLYPSISVGYLFHRDLYQAVYGKIELGYDLRTGFGVNLKSAVGLGYLHTFATRTEYQLDNGSYLPARDQGNARIMPTLSIGLGYRLRPSDPASPEIFSLYEAWLEYPYSPGFIPLMTHTNLHLGIKFYR